MNLKELATKVSLFEGGKVNLPIAQISEVIKCLSIIGYEHDCKGVIEADFVQPKDDVLKPITCFPKDSIFAKLYRNGKKHFEVRNGKSRLGPKR